MLEARCLSVICFDCVFNPKLEKSPFKKVLGIVQNDQPLFVTVCEVQSCLVAFSHSRSLSHSFLSRSGLMKTTDTRTDDQGTESKDNPCESCPEVVSTDPSPPTPEPSSPSKSELEEKRYVSFSS